MGGEEPRALWERLRAERRARGAAAGTAGEVAETVILQKWSFNENGGNSYGGPGCIVRTKPGGWTTERRDAAIGIDAITNKITNLSIRSWPSVRVSPRIPTAAEVAAAIGTPGDLSGCIIYMDPPYAGTTSYTADLSREEVVAHARDFASLGATVAISEAEPIPALTGLGWYATEITGGRVGQKRTFSKQQQEIITMNKQPQYTVPTQSSLFP